MLTVRLFFIIPAIIFSLFFTRESVFAIGYASGTCTDIGDGVDCAQTPQVPLNDCQVYGNMAPPPDNVCFQNPWTFQYTICQACKDPNIFGKCNYNYQYITNSCNTGDRCEDPSVGNIQGQTGAGAGTGSNSTGHILPGICYASAFDGKNPNTACIAGEWYKTCCTLPGRVDPTTSCSGGGCSNGDVAPPNQTSCNTPTPTPTPTPPPSCQGTALSCSNPQCQSGYTAVKITNGNYVCANTSTGQIDCNTAPYCLTGCPTTPGYTGQSCACGSGNVARACATNSGNKCPSCSLDYCVSYTPGLCCYYHDATCFNDSTNCGTVGCNGGGCPPNSTRTTCNGPNACVQ